jgi:hypothetical protein
VTTFNNKQTKESNKKQKIAVHPAERPAAKQEFASILF